MIVDLFTFLSLPTTMKTIAVNAGMTLLFIDLPDHLNLILIELKKTTIFLAINVSAQYLWVIEECLVWNWVIFTSEYKKIAVFVILL